MTYQQAIDFLFSALPMYQRDGKSAFKKDLVNTHKLMEALDNPHQQFKSVHVAGTNGKGSSSHMLASVLQEAGYKVGLYTSPHLKSFTERVRVNGEAISEARVVDFVTQNKAEIESIGPSFFEMTVAMAFDHFASSQVDIAVIEVGLGGRLDSTNVIDPEACLITNIGWDHMDMLGDTLAKIAYEKAGIIKTGVPVVIGTTQSETTAVFNAVAQEKAAPIHFASPGQASYETDLLGKYQQKNIPGVLSTVERLIDKGWKINEEQLRNGLMHVGANTGLKGRWQILSQAPLTVCDTGHNVEGVREIVSQISETQHQQLHVVLGFVNDKKVGEVLNLFPAEAQYIFCKSQVPRAMPLDTLRLEAEKLGIKAEYVPDVNDALAVARSRAAKDDFIFVGGSTFVVAELEEL